MLILRRITTIRSSKWKTVRLIAVELLENRPSINAGELSGEYQIFLFIFSDLAQGVVEDTTHQTAHPKFTILLECPIISFSACKSTKKIVFLTDNAETINILAVLGDLRGEKS